jgi:hypothetical protein
MFQPHLATIFATMGRPAVYAAPDTDPVPLRVIRLGGGQPINIGPVTIMLERVRFEVLRSALPDPVPGATLAVDGTTWTVEAAQPVEDDAYGLKWSLDVSWGAAVMWRSVSGTGASQNPPSITGAVTLAASAAAGTGAVSLCATYAVGRLLTGDTLTIGATVHAVTAPSQASSNSFAAVGIIPALPDAVMAGQGVTLAFARDAAVTAAISGYQARELQGGVQAGDIRLVLLPGAAAALPEVPKISDIVIVPNIGALRAINVAPLYQGGRVAGWEAQARR